LQDEAYDAITCLELIAYLPKDEYRLLFSELARLIKPEGTLICSTPIDVDSEDALQRFASLAESEFVIEEWLFSWHKLYLSLRNFTEAPTRFFKSYKDPKYRARQIERRRGFFKAWFRLNSSTIPQILWCPLHFLTSPIASWIRQSRSLLLFCEKICRLLYSDQGISHAIFTAKRRPLEFTPKDEQPRETKHKKELWE
jgi:SAM-dependent methyltransferase